MIIVDKGSGRISKTSLSISRSGIHRHSGRVEIVVGDEWKDLSEDE